MLQKKQQLGQFFTKNTNFILSGFEGVVKNRNVTDPFAGDGDLLHWAKNNGASTIKGFDIDESKVDNQTIFYNDSLKNPITYDFVLTNPPYLYQNKLREKFGLKESVHTDLYQLSLEKIMDSNEGIVIVPINFFSSENAKYIRMLFLDRFNIVSAKYFTEQVFEDTTYNVIVFHYIRKRNYNSEQTFTLSIQPKNENKEITIYQDYNWQIGGEFLAKINENGNRLRIGRLEESDLQKGEIKIRTAYNHLNTHRDFFVDRQTYNLVRRNIILLKAIDTGTKGGEICLEDIRDYGIDAFVSIKTSRNQIGLIFSDEITLSEQEKLIPLFNKVLNEKRNEYESLFMTNFRDKGRKRISFDFAYNLLNFIYFNNIKNKRDTNESKQNQLRLF